MKHKIVIPKTTLLALMPGEVSSKILIMPQFLTEDGKADHAAFQEWVKFNKIRNGQNFQIIESGVIVSVMNFFKLVNISPSVRAMLFARTLCKLYGPLNPLRAAQPAAEYLAMVGPFLEEYWSSVPQEKIRLLNEITTFFDMPGRKAMQLMCDMKTTRDLIEEYSKMAHDCLKYLDEF